MKKCNYPSQHQYSLAAQGPFACVPRTAAAALLVERAASENVLLGSSQVLQVPDGLEKLLSHSTLTTVNTSL